MWVYNQLGDGSVFDRVIVATQANKLGFLDDSQFREEREILENIGFDAGELFTATKPYIEDVLGALLMGAFPLIENYVW